MIEYVGHAKDHRSCLHTQSFIVLCADYVKHVGKY